jgi:hypothetical protein
MRWRHGVHGPASTGHHVSSLTVDGADVPVTESYTFNVTTTHTIAAAFALNVAPFPLAKVVEFRADAGGAGPYPCRAAGPTLT